MRCDFCASEFDDSLAQCPVCGAPAKPGNVSEPVINAAAPVAPVAPAGQSYASVYEQNAPAAQAPQFAPVAPAVNPVLVQTHFLLRDKLYLAICILFTASCIFSVAGEISGFPLLTVLASIFLWIGFSKGRNEVLDPKPIHWVGGVVFANKVISYVVAVIMVVCGVLFAAMSNVFKSMTSGDFNDIIEKTDDPDVQEAIRAFERFSLDAELSQFMGYLGWILFAIFVITAILIFVITHFSIGNFHKLIKSDYESIVFNRVEIKKQRATFAWLIVFAVFAGISMLSNLSNGNFIMACASGCITAGLIISAILVKKYLYDIQPAPDFQQMPIY